MNEESSADLMADLFLSYDIDDNQPYKLGNQPWGRKVVDLIWYNSEDGFSRTGLGGHSLECKGQRVGFKNAILDMVQVAKQVIDEE